MSPSHQVQPRMWRLLSGFWGQPGKKERGGKGLVGGPKRKEESEREKEGGKGERKKEEKERREKKRPKEECSCLWTGKVLSLGTEMSEKLEVRCGWAARRDIGS